MNLPNTESYSDDALIGALHERLREASHVIAKQNAQIREQRETIKRQRAKNSALRKERWINGPNYTGGFRKAYDELAAAAPKTDPRETRRFYHRDDAFVDGIKHYEIAPGAAYAKDNRGGSLVAGADWLEAADRFVPQGIWIEVRGTNIPADLPKPPPIPEGHQYWRYHPFGWKTETKVRFVFTTTGSWTGGAGPASPSGQSDHYLEAVAPPVSEVKKTIVRAGTPEDKIAGLGMMYQTPPPKTRVFRSVRGFDDGTDRVEVYPSGEGATITKGGQSNPLSAWHISLLDPDGAVGEGVWYEVKDDPAPLKVKMRKMAEVVVTELDNQKMITVQAALRAKLGRLPSIAECRARLHRVIDHNRVEHWLWLDKSLNVGEKAPLDKAICRINPPSFTPNQES